MSADGQRMKSERVWDPLVRLFHWSLVAAFATAWWERGEAVIHETAGKVVLGLIIFRSVWGLIGPASARFETFVRGPRQTFSYVLSIFGGKPVHHIGHNPAGAVMIGLMLLTLTVTTASGILMTTTALWGNAWIEWIHGVSSNLMLFLIVGHLLGILAAAIQHRENLIWSMVTGWKWVPFETEPYLGHLKLTLKSLLAAAFVLVAGIGIWNASASLLNASGWRMHKILLAELKTAGCTEASVTGPRIEIFPELRLVYDVHTDGDPAVQTKAIPAGLALSKRLSTDLSAFTERCPKVAEPVEAQHGELESLEAGSTDQTQSITYLHDRPKGAAFGMAPIDSNISILPSRSAVELIIAQPRGELPSPLRGTGVEIAETISSSLAEVPVANSVETALPTFQPASATEIAARLALLDISFFSRVDSNVSAGVQETGAFKVMKPQKRVEKPSGMRIAKAEKWKVEALMRKVKRLKKQRTSKWGYYPDRRGPAFQFSGSQSESDDDDDDNSGKGRGRNRGGDPERDDD